MAIKIALSVWAVWLIIRVIVMIVYRKKFKTLGFAEREDLISSYKETNMTLYILLTITIILATIVQYFF